jgi:hypothetical protein
MAWCMRRQKDQAKIQQTAGRLGWGDRTSSPSWPGVSLWDAHTSEPTAKSEVNLGVAGCGARRPPSGPVSPTPIKRTRSDTGFTRGVTAEDRIALRAQRLKLPDVANQPIRCLAPENAVQLRVIPTAQTTDPFCARVWPVVLEDSVAENGHRTGPLVLPGAAHADRRCTGDQTKWQILHRHHALRSPRTTA